MLLAMFTDSQNDRKIYTNLDTTGWVFASAKPNDTYLSRVICTVGGFIKENVTYDSRELKFTIPANGQIGYFGNVTFKFDYEPSLKPTMLMGGAIAGAAAGMGVQPQMSVTIENKFQDATKEYLSRYADTSAKLKPTQYLITKTATQNAKN